MSEIVDVVRRVCSRSSDYGRDQIVQVVNVIPSERPTERKMEQIGGLLPHQIVAEAARAIFEENKDVPQERISQRTTKESVEVVRLVLQEYVQRTVKQFVDVPGADRAILAKLFRKSAFFERQGGAGR